MVLEIYFSMSNSLPYREPDLQCRKKHAVAWFGLKSALKGIVIEGVQVAVLCMIYGRGGFPCPLPDGGYFPRFFRSTRGRTLLPSLDRQLTGEGWGLILNRSLPYREMRVPG